MLHNKLFCVHCGNPFSFDEHSELLSHNNTFKGACANCHEIYLFTVHVIDDVMDFRGNVGQSIMIDPLPLRPPPEIPKAAVVKNKLGEELLRQATGGKLSKSNEEFENYSKETLKDLVSVFDPKREDDA